MAVIMICALLAAFMICILFGKRFIPWLKKKDIVQPIKDEVASIYDVRESGSADRR